MISETHAKTGSHWFVPHHAGCDDEPLDAWLKQQLGREFDSALDEDVPEALLDLLRDLPPTRH